MGEQGVEPVEIQGAILGKGLIKDFRYQKLVVWIANFREYLYESASGSFNIPGKSLATEGLAFDYAGEIYLIERSPDGGLRGNIVVNDAAFAIGPANYLALNSGNPAPGYTEQVISAWQEYFADAAAQNLDPVSGTTLKVRAVRKKSPKLS